MCMGIGLHYATRLKLFDPHDVILPRCRIRLIVEDAIELQKDIDKLKGDAQRAKEEKVTGKVPLQQRMFLCKFTTLIS